MRNVAINICDLFESLLAENNLYIPNDDREGNEDEACLFGEDYYNLEDAITGILKKLCNQIKDNPDININEETI